MEDLVLHRRNNAARIQEDIDSLRRTIMVENWMENYCSSHFPSNSGSSTDSSISSFSETESCKSIFSSAQHNAHIPVRLRPGRISQLDRQPGTKSRARKNVSRDLTKVKEPVSPGARIANFLNSIFSPRNSNKNLDQGLEEWSSMRKPRSVKNPTTCSLASRSCLSKNPSSGIVSLRVPTIGSKFIKKNIESLGLYEGKNLREDDLRDYCQKERDVDDMSCTSSELFELENIGRVGTRIV
ncbi:protein BIG GRAIN 1-like B [Sesamum alatum]|uniref:Protein BIG GRAIN 1-like B n=1 Tax=Sesamum alatum TaxID=300844 RepID=A0AAE1YMP2_9LAMI|nr:protein BIG GRAIN 1-like B [Sesamum alatum]